MTAGVVQKEAVQYCKSRLGRSYSSKSPALVASLFCVLLQFDPHQRLFKHDTLDPVLSVVPRVPELGTVSSLIPADQMICSSQTRLRVLMCGILMKSCPRFPLIPPRADSSHHHSMLRCLISQLMRLISITLVTLQWFPAHELLSSL